MPLPLPAGQESEALAFLFKECDLQGRWWRALVEKNEPDPVGKGRGKVQMTVRWNVDMGPETSVWQGTGQLGP